jgi:hypothetical protein
VGFDYFQVSWYIVYAIAAISIPIFLIRLLRTIPYYVKHGKMGDNDDGVYFSFKKTFKEKVIMFLYETHPGAIAMDAVFTGLSGLLVWMAWGLIPIIGTVALIIYGLTSFAKQLRNRHLKKEEFVEALKGK